MSCREGCRSKDHASYAECLRSANVQVNGVVNSPNQSMFETTKRDLAAYAAAKAEGISPMGTSASAVADARAATKMLGRPYEASTDPPPKMIATKTAARFVNWKE